jgi:hypothetical protein
MSQAKVFLKASGIRSTKGLLYANILWFLMY